MDGAIFDLTIFLGATFAAALVAGLAGFAFGLVAAAAWLHILTPIETATLIIGYGLIVQGISVWKLRDALSWHRLWPFLLGGAVGVPIGAVLLTWMNPAVVRSSIGIVLVMYAIYGLARPQLKPVSKAGNAADIGAGIVNGVLGGMTGLAGIVVTIWCCVRGRSKDVQRAVFQPVAVATFAMSALWIGATGALTMSTAKPFAFGLPVLLGGTWLGLKFFGRLDGTAFRRTVLILLLVSGAALIVPML
jgi:uncharacterized membrane protein YfcA